MAGKGLVLVSGAPLSLGEMASDEDTVVSVDVGVFEGIGEAVPGISVGFSSPEGVYVGVWVPSTCNADAGVGPIPRTQEAKYRDAINRENNKYLLIGIFVKLRFIELNTLYIILHDATREVVHRYGKIQILLANLTQNYRVKLHHALPRYSNSATKRGG